MTEIKYPRNPVIRSSFMALGRFLVKLLTTSMIEGFENYPHSGRLIVVGNHSGAMETVLMTSFAPRQIEYMGSIDIPPEPRMACFMNAYQFIPVYRGNVSLSAMKAAVSVLNQNGVIGIFPEGGIWEPSIRNAHSGVAWMSYHGQAPILPIGFAPTAGALGKALKLKRPELRMKIGELIPPVKLKPGIPKKIQFQSAAQEIMEAIWNLIPEEGIPPAEKIHSEKFEFQVAAFDTSGKNVEIPDNLRLINGPSLSKILYRTTLINNFAINLGLDITSLKKLDQSPMPSEIAAATAQILNYLETENPYYFTYRYGQREGERMQNSLLELNRLAEWAAEHKLSLAARPIRRYMLNGSSEIIEETHPIELAKW